MFATRDLAVYASIIGTLDGAWAIYAGAFRDRPRLVVRVREGIASPANNVITVLLARDDVHTYRGPFDPQRTVLDRTDLHGLRERLIAFRQQSPLDGPPPVCIIKTLDGTRYGRVIDVVDEVSIAGIGRFSVQDSLYAGERMLLEQPLQARAER